ncbi:MAG: hypothetical protein HWE13_10410 [Gammaproteobacteria bacterium]|nr:hypothetical protein [Gammaproteobacteria bacterium]NVK88532.1 hypothetical protein [Gammaproteobacteria bacterium]
MTEFKEIAQNPDWQLGSFVPQTSSLRFYKNSAAARKRHNFYDHDYISGVKMETFDVPMQALIADKAQLTTTKDIGIIAHTAFCGSTLMGRAMHDVYQWSSVREPNILMECSVFKVDNPDFATMQNPFWRDLLDVVVLLLAKDSERAATVIKLSNSMNNLLGDLQATADYRVTILFNTLTEFLISNYKKQGFQQFIGQLLQFYSRMPTYGAIIQQHARQLNDARAVGLLWALQQDLLAKQKDSIAAQRCKTLPAEQVFGDLPKAVTDVAEFFCGHSLPAADRDNPLFQEHSKYQQQAYSVAAKNAEDEAIIQQHQAAFTEAETFTQQVRELHRLQSL